MAPQLISGFGKAYLNTEYDGINGWVYNNWIGYQTHSGIVMGANVCLEVLKEHRCAYLLNDNREVVGPWDHAVEWIVEDWAPRAIAQGLTHFANVVSLDTMAAESAQAMRIGIGKTLEMQLFDDMEKAQTWLRAAQRTASATE